MERLSSRFGAYLAAQLGLDEERQAVISFGALALLQNGSSALLTLVLARIFGILPETLAAIAVTGLMRHYSGGVHLGTPLRCTVLTTVIFVGSGTMGAVAFNLLTSGGGPLLILAVTLSLLLAGCWPYFRYAPVAAASLPLRAERRAHLRAGTIRCLVLAAFFIPSGLAAGYSWAAGALFGFLLQGVTLTPVGHRITTAIDSALDRTFGR